MSRNGQPAHPLDQLLAELRTTWGGTANINVERRHNTFWVTVKCRTGDTTWETVDTHEIPT